MNRYANFCDTERLVGYNECTFDPTAACEHTEELRDVHNIIAGPSSGAAFWLAKEVATKDPDAKIVFISADGTLGTSPAEYTHKHRSLSSAAVEQPNMAEAGGLMLTCSGCGCVVNGAVAAAFRCPNCESRPDADHVLCPSADTPNRLEILHKTGATQADLSTGGNPFVDFRHMMYSHRVGMARGMSDSEYVAMADQLNGALESVEGGGFQETPLIFCEELNCFLKNETDNVAQSHKARHLANVMLYLMTLKATGMDELTERRLAVASCGNAGLAAATIAAAAGWPIDVCIPPSASDVVKARLNELGASVVICDRDGPGSVETAMGSVSTEGTADPTLAVCRSLVAEHGSIPFSVQGPECGLAVEGGQTLGFEIAAALSRGHPQVDTIGNIFIQVGGGALGAGLSQGLIRAHEAGLSNGNFGAADFHCVQPQGNQPLHRAFSAMNEKAMSAKEAATQRAAYMSAWENPHSVASGILDDETYDWVALCDAMQKTGGSSHVVQDDTICEAKEIAEKMGVPVCHTGAAGLAGLLEHRRSQDAAMLAGAAPDLVILSGLDRDQR